MTESKNTVVKAILAASISLVSTAGLLMATFIFVCFMKLSDGPSGDNMEAPPMIILPLMSLYYPSLLFYLAMKDGFERGEWNGRIRYTAMAVTVAVLVIASIGGWRMNVVQWDADFIHLQPLSRLSAVTGCLLSVLSVIEFLLNSRRTQLDTSKVC
jgi:hypothetical protein